MGKDLFNYLFKSENVKNILVSLGQLHMEWHHIVVIQRWSSEACVEVE